MAYKRAVRGIVRLAGKIFFVWGSLAVAKGFWDCFAGAPEANAFSPRPWMFVTRAQWLRYAGFELAYGFACLALGAAVFSFARRLPEWAMKERFKEEIL